jgi:hypothetical protein
MEMINIEEELFSNVATRVRNEYPDIYMVGEYVKSPPSFPCVSLIEMDNSVYTKTQTSDGDENHSQVMYELNVYSNKLRAKKSECKKITALIDSVMLEYGFTRTMLQPIPNMDDATIYRMLARYTAVVSKEKEIYRR